MAISICSIGHNVPHVLTIPESGSPQFALTDTILAQRDSLARAIFDKEISEQHRRILASLVLEADLSTGLADPGREKIAHTNGVSVRTVSRAIAELEDHGYLTVRRGVGRSRTAVAVNRPTPDQLEDAISSFVSGLRNSVPNSVPRSQRKAPPLKLHVFENIEQNSVPPTNSVTRIGGITPCGAGYYADFVEENSVPQGDIGNSVPPNSVPRVADLPPHDAHQPTDFVEQNSVPRSDAPIQEAIDFVKQNSVPRSVDPIENSVTSPDLDAAEKTQCFLRGRALEDSNFLSNGFESHHQKEPHILENRKEGCGEKGKEIVSSTHKKQEVKRGTRLDADWKLPRSWGMWAVENFTVSPDDVRAEAGRFADFWLSKSGQDATKVDWRRTWQNWIRTAAERKRWKRRRIDTKVAPDLLSSAPEPESDYDRDLREVRERIKRQQEAER